MGKMKIYISEQWRHGRLRRNKRGQSFPLNPPASGAFHGGFQTYQGLICLHQLKWGAPPTTGNMPLRKVAERTRSKVKVWVCLGNLQAVSGLAPLWVGSWQFWVPWWGLRSRSGEGGGNSEGEEGSRRQPLRKEYPHLYCPWGESDSELWGKD